ncbi:hypothetical protein LCGC14_1944460, partial [marine sediment metagenome]
MAAKSKKKELVEKHDQLPDYIRSKGPARGSEEVKSADLVIPRLEIVQSLSPARKKTDPMFIEGAEEGMIFNNVTRELYADVRIVPVYFRKEFLIWKDREHGGGFRGAFPSQPEAEEARTALEDGEFCAVIDTAQHFCLIVRSNGRSNEIVVSM